MRPSAAELKSFALDRLEDMLDLFCPGGQRAAGNYTPKNPTRPDKRPGSFVIRVAGAAKGSFNEYATGEKGDVIDLVSYFLTRGSPDFQSNARRGEALRWIADFCGLQKMPAAARAAASDAARRRVTASEAEAGKLETKRARAFKMWVAGAPIENTAVERYLRRRGLELEAIRNREDDLRCIRSQEYWLERKRDGGQVTSSGPRFPCMAAAMRDGLGHIRAVHFTFLTDDGFKAPVGQPKLIWPDYAGMMIRLARGPSGLSVEEAIAKGWREAVAVTEGIEDGLTVALAAPELRVWAAGSLNNVAKAPFLPLVNGWVIHRQQEKHYSTVMAFDRVKRALEKHGVPVAELAAHGAKDVNAMLMKRE